MKLTRIVPVVAALSLLAACSPTSGTAAAVDGTTLSESRVTQIIDGCVDASGGTAENFPRRAIVQTFLIARLFDRVAANAEEITPESIAGVARQQYPALMDDEACSDLALDSIKTSFLDQVDRALVIKQAQAADVDLNPRYGSWDPRSEGLFGSSSLSVPAGQ